MWYRVLGRGVDDGVVRLCDFEIANRGIPVAIFRVGGGGSPIKRDPFKRDPSSEYDVLHQQYRF